MTKPKARAALKAVMPWAVDITIRDSGPAPDIEWGVRCASAKYDHRGFRPDYYGCCGYGATLADAVSACIAVWQTAAKRRRAPRSEGGRG